MNAVGSIDENLGGIIRKIPAWTKPIMLGATLAGNITPLFTILLLCYLLAPDNKRVAAIFIAAVIFLNVGLKQFIHRPRPDTLYVSKMRFKTHSFPSGHAFGAITAYGFVAYLTLHYLDGPLGTFYAALLCILIFFIGM
jgi:membrane-associated phospholipid phosphatase